MIGVIAMFSEEYVIDDSTMPSPEEESQYPPLSAEQKRKLDERLDKVFEEFWLMQSNLE